MHLVSIGLSCSGFSFYEHFNSHDAIFYIKNRKMCVSKKILYQYFVIFSPAFDSFCIENFFMPFIA